MYNVRTITVKDINDIDVSCSYLITSAFLILCVPLF